MSKWDEIRKTGILAFLLSLPIMLWRSIGVGRRLAWITAFVVIFWMAGKTVDFTFDKIVNRWRFENESSKMAEWVKEAQRDLDSVRGGLKSIDFSVEQRSEKKYSELLEVLRSKVSEFDDEVDELDRGISAIREEQRAGVKLRIIDLREKVKILGQNIDSKSVRIEFEDIFQNINVLDNKEKRRFIKDLEDMGFYLDRKDDEIVMIRRSGYPQAFASSVDATFVSYVGSSVSYDSMFTFRREDE